MIFERLRAWLNGDSEVIKRATGIIHGLHNDNFDLRMKLARAEKEQEAAYHIAKRSVATFAKRLGIKTENWCDVDKAIRDLQREVDAYRVGQAFLEEHVTVAQAERAERDELRALLRELGLAHVEISELYENRIFDDRTEAARKRDRDATIAIHERARKLAQENAG